MDSIHDSYRTNYHTHMTENPPVPDHTNMERKLALHNIDSVNGYILYCHGNIKKMFMENRYGSLSNSTKNEVYNLEMSRCLEHCYMRCLKHATESHKTTPPNPTEDMNLCDSLIVEYMKLNRPK
jgi:hypothetical protein